MMTTTTMMMIMIMIMVVVRAEFVVVVSFYTGGGGGRRRLRRLFVSSKVSKKIVRSVFSLGENAELSNSSAPGLLRFCRAHRAGSFGGFGGNGTCARGMSRRSKRTRDNIFESSKKLKISLSFLSVNAYK